MGRTEASLEKVLPGGVTVITDVCFARVDETPLLCDIYLPVGVKPTVGEAEQRPAASLSNALPGSYPAAIVVHGGAWLAGDKWAIGIHARNMAEAGIVAVSINYRLAPASKFPAQVDDLRSALVWLHDSADQYHVDLQRVALMGYSAGGHLSCLVGTLADAAWDEVKQTTLWSEEDARWQRLPKLKCVVGGGAPCDLVTFPDDPSALSYLFGQSREDVPGVYAAASPVTHASAGDPPTLLVHGSGDTIVPLEISRKLYEAQLAAGVDCKFVSLPGPGHMMTFLDPRTKKATLEFLSKHLQP